MKEHDYKFYSELRKESISLSQVPKSIKNSWHFLNLIDAKTLDTEKFGRGSKIVIKNSESFESFFSKYFSSDEDSTVISKASNIKKLRDSKARKTKTTSIFFIRGFKNIVLNGKTFDLAYYTNSFGLFSVQQPSIYTEKVCFIENLDSFLKAEKLLGNDYIYLHKYGRIGINSLKEISATEILVFVDYDFNGLDEYLRIKSKYENATLFIPENFDVLLANYGKEINGKQQQSQRVALSKQKEVIKIRELVSKTNRFLEQEILSYD
jgi:hypothetical protein